MIPKNPDSDFNQSKQLVACHKETQTNNTTVKDSGTATTSGTKGICDQGSHKVFEFSEIVQDSKHPKDITIIKDIFAEEIHDHSSSSLCDEAVSNRYTYCREVIKPYLKDYPTDCPISDEQLIKDALEAAHQDFPDYEPCFDSYEGKGPLEPLDKKKPVKESIPVDDNSIKSICVKSCKDTCTDDKGSKDSSKTSICKKKKKCPSKCSISEKNSSDSKPKSEMDSDKECPPKPKCPKKDKCPPPIGVCEGDKGLPLGPPPICKENNDNQGTSSKKCKEKTSSKSICKPVSAAPKKGEKRENKECEENILAQDLEKLKSFIKESASCLFKPKEKQKTIMEAHNEAIATIKLAVEDFFGKVYKTTKEAVTLIKTESVKQLERITSKKSNSCKSEDLKPQKVHDNNSTDTLTRFRFFKSTEKPDSDEDTDDENSGHSFNKTAERVVSKIFTQVGSTVTTLTENIDLEKVASMIKVEKDYNDDSSSCDKVHNSEDRDTGNSVFTTIKSKIVAMFSEEENEEKPSIPENTIISSEYESSDEDIMDT